MAYDSFGPIRRIIALLIILTIILLSVNEQSALADEKVTPAIPEFKIKVCDDESVFTITVSKTQDADGYRIYVKEPGSAKYVSLATIKKNGKKARTYTYSPFNPGEYSFRIKAYHKNGKKKAWSKVSATKTVTVKSDILSRVPVGIRFADGIKTDFKSDLEEPGGSDKNKYKLEYTCDEGLENAVVRLYIVNSDGTRADNAPFTYDEKDASVGYFNMGECYAVLYAFAKEGDVNLRNPLARSEKLKLRAMDENGNTAVKYADITFKNGYAYFGTAPTEFISDKTLKDKIIKTAERDHEFFLYNGDVYLYDEKFDNGPYKYVPAEWRILEQTDDYVLLMNNALISAGGYDGWREVKNTTWATSCLYYMLNHSHEYTKEERTFWPTLRLPDERTLIDMEMCGVTTRIGIPTLEMLTNAKYGFSTSTAADKNRIVSPSKFYEGGKTDHPATRNGLLLYGCYWVANEKAGQTICVDQKGKILIGEFDCNVYELGVVNVIKVNLNHCNVYYK